MGHVTRRMTRMSVSIALLLALAGALAGCGLVQSAQEAGERGSGVSGSSTGVEMASPEMGATDEMKSSVESYDTAPTAGAGEDASTIPLPDRLVIRNVALRVQVDDVEASVDKIRAAVSSNKGSVTNLQVSTDNDQPVYRYDAQGSLADGSALSGWMTVRIPADKLDAFSKEVSALGEVLRQSADESDVTQEHVDLSARLKNLQAQETRLREFFSSAKKVDEMLAIEQELGRVRGDIESMQAQIAYLERQAAMATVTIELVEPQAVVRPSGTDWGFVASVTQAIRAFVGTINGLIIIFGAVLPILLIALALFFVIRAVLRSRAKRHADEPQDAEE
ncbi:MAG: DUF4349 domain-containing protein [Actinomycetota bacterium]|nr:DUF4349 domain-containing protein [Actinomycetota bacterium]